ncbi:MAG TPA: flavin reductase [Acidimicrobiales bacterium]|nr:flavin reductase [Acidimicrobiales bacterium]
MSAARDQQRFKAAARRFASGVTVVTTSLEGEVHGITASSFCSLSLDPLLVSVAVHERSRIVAMVERADCFAISVLSRSQRDLSHHFARAERPTSGHAFGAATYPAATGAPIIAGCIAYFDCRLHSVIPGGDHRILVGEVVDAGESHGEPLLYFEGDYHGLGAAQHLEEPEASGSPRNGATDELLVVQEAVEPAVAELAASAATDDDLVRLRSLLRSAATAIVDPRRFTMLGFEFHVALADASHNRRLRELAASLRPEQQIVYEPRTDEKRAREVLAAHEEILSHVGGRNPAAARAAMAAHVEDMHRHVAGGSAPAPQPGDSSMGRTSIPSRMSASTERPR